ncbi:MULTISPECIES: DUF885 family protein [Gammaproteobacteria]|uniref:DUF885 domain-containing protein n=1 Tax=Gammaproteobacteria TaxID=1236 RepID=UPI000DCFBD0A|nr:MULTISPECIES: DUF885 domain-containing protein [Gammaproteobacteria]RTE87671.1 DUF885 domain-containing protein [Aliidiomarina sp. B3213]TCZ92545.1 DUF885 domain-containing protein [Lysobacter sp. N42]
MRKIIPLVVVFFLAACGQAPQTETQEQDTMASQAEHTEAFNTWLDEQYEIMLQRSPMQLTTMGRKDRYGELDDMSVEGEAENLAFYQNMVQTMRDTFDYDELTADARLSWDIIEYSLDRQQSSAEFNEYGYIFNQMQGAHTGLVQFMIAYHRVDTAEDMEAYISRLGELARAIGQLTERAQSNAEAGIRAPRFAYDTVILETRGLISGQPFDDSERPSPLWSDVNNKVNALLENETITADQADSLKQQASEALVSEVQPAYAALANWLEADIVNTVVNPTGVNRHEGGLAYYQDRLKQHTTTDLTADQIHQIGLDEVARIRAQMEDIQEQMGFEGTFTEFFEYMRTDERFFYPDTDEGRQGYLDDSTAYIEAITEKLPEYFGILPQADLVVKRVEAYREQDGAAQHYSRGTPDGSRPGVYYAHLSDMTSMPKTDMEAIAYHEGNPGHHMQISIAQELENIPKFRTTMFFTVFVEGWALYAEELAVEMGGYQELYSEFGRLGSEIWRAVRLVVDTGMHAKGWTEEEAFEYFMANVPTAEASARSEIQRYLVMPGQATSYKMGMIKIQELRAHAEQELGENFDIRGFHDTILGGGALPLPLLERRVMQWIEESR